eukprot:GHUV01004013.1.p1 GENE.GHUV01004013.1~~GHUV01004013.1.p1  ORF type:complete len:658 (+),score=172.12 GHUV01004013.1:226-2199(+)
MSSEQSESPSTQHLETTNTELEPIDVRLASHYYNSSTAAAGAAAAAALAAKMTTNSSRPSTTSRTPSGTRFYGNNSQQNSSKTLERKHSDESALNLTDVEQLDGAVVAIEDYTGGFYHPATAPKDTFWPCTFNLAKVIMGAGMMAVPKAFNMLGLIPGLAIMALMLCLVFFTLASLVSATAATGAGNSYGALVRRTVGGAADHILQVAVLLNCYIMNIVFLVVLGDILVGTAPEYAGLLPELLRYAGPDLSPANCFWLGRPVVLGVLSLCVLLPLSSMRSMEKLAVVNIVGVASNGVFAALMVALAAGAAANGVLQPPRLLPTWSDFGSSSFAIGMSLASIAPVLLNTNVCHQSLHPLMPLLRPYSVSRMQRLAATALGICNSLYLVVTLCAGLVFGEALDADVLTNVNVAAMGPLIGPAAAVVMACAVRLGYLLSLIGSYVLLMYPLRQCIGDLMLPGGQRAVLQQWQTLTIVLVGTIYCIGCYLPSIWGALALVGATASTVQAFIIPGLVVMSVERLEREKVTTSGYSRAARQQQQAGGLRAALLAPEGDEESPRESVAHPPGPSSARSAQQQRQAAGAAAGTKPKQGLPVGSLLRQAVAVLVILLGVGLFANSALNFAWDYMHPRMAGASGVELGASRGSHLMQQYRQVFSPLL